MTQKYIPSLGRLGQWYGRILALHSEYRCTWLAKPFSIMGYVAGPGHLENIILKKFALISHKIDLGRRDCCIA